MMGSGTNADLYVDENKNHANNTVRYSTVHYSTVQYSTIQYSTVQYNVYFPLNVRREINKKNNNNTVQFSPVYPALLVEYDESPSAFRYIVMRLWVL